MLSCLNAMIRMIFADLRHFASSSGGLVVSIDPDNGTVSSLSFLASSLNLLNGLTCFWHCWLGNTKCILSAKSMTQLKVLF